MPGSSPSIPVSAKERKKEKEKEETTAESMDEETVVGLSGHLEFMSDILLVIIH